MTAVGSPAVAASASAKKTGKFKPRTGTATTLASTSSFPSFKTAGFGLKAQTTQEVIIIPDSPSTSSGSLKRNSSDPSLIIEPSPQAPKRPKRDGFANKENSTVRSAPVQDTKGKGKASEMDFDGEVCRDRRTPLEEKGVASPKPPIRSARTKPATPAPHPMSLPNTSNTATETPEQIRAFIAHCHSLRYPIMNDTVEFYTKNDTTKDIVTLKAIADLLDNRIRELEGRLKDSSSSRTEPWPAPPPMQHVTMPPPEEGTDIIDMTDVQPYETSISKPADEAIDVDDFYDPDEEDLWKGYDEPDLGMADPMPPIPETPVIVAPQASSSVTLPSRSPSPVDTRFQNSNFLPLLRQVLRSTFNLQDFRKNQLEAVVANMEGRDVFVLMPTGGGKSLCYQLPAVCVSNQKKQTTIVVTPLLALMEDQVKQLKQRFRVNAIAWNSESIVDEQAVAAGRHPIIYVTPEKLSSSGHTRNFLQRLDQQGLLARFVIDEAHCISTWGQDFREAYANLGELRNNYPSVPIMALTATANRTTIQDIIAQLKLKNPVSLVQSFNRPNLSYTVREKKSKFVEMIVADLRGRFQNQAGVIYCRAKQTCENVCADLRKHGIRAGYYHAGLSSEDRARAASDWMDGRTTVVVATIAFGMGIDKADVRYVIHYDMPKNMSGYYQETGRAGRDGLPADCILYYNFADFRASRNMIDRDENTTPDSKRRQTLALEEIYAYCRNCSKCRRSEVLRHFDEVFDPKKCNKTCDVCSNSTPLLETNASDIARSLIKLITAGHKAKMDMPAGQITAALKGSQSQDGKKYQHLPGFGDAKGDDKDLVDLVIQDLLFAGVLHENVVQNQHNRFHTTYVVPGPKIYDFERSLNTKPLVIPWRPKKVSAKLASRSATGSRSVDASKPASSRKRGKAKEIADDPIEDDMYDDDDGVSYLMPSTSLRKTRSAVVAAAAPVPVAASTSISAPVPSRTNSRGNYAAASPAPLQKSPAEVANAEKKKYQDIFARLQEVRQQLMIKNRLSSPEDVLDDPTLQTVALMSPTDFVSFKNVVSGAVMDQFEGPNAKQDAMDHANLKWNLFGNDFLRAIIEVLQANSTTKSSGKAPAPAASTSKPASRSFQAAEYVYRPSASVAASKSSGSASAAPTPMLTTTPLPRQPPPPVSLAVPGVSSKPSGQGKKKFQPK